MTEFWTPLKRILGYLRSADFSSAYALLVTQATTETPEVLTVAEDTIVGRKAGGGIDDLSASDVVTLLGLDNCIWTHAENTDVDTGTEVIDSFVIDSAGASIFGSCLWTFFAYKATGPETFASGYVSARFNETNIVTVYDDAASTQPVFSITLTDLGDGHFGVYLNATVSTDSWHIQVMRAPHMHVDYEPI